MANQKCIIDVPLIAKKAREAGNENEYKVEVALPDGTKVDLICFLFGAPRQEIQAGGGTCNGICW